MDHYSEPVTRDSGILHEMFWGELSSPGTFLRSSAIRAAVINPAAGVGLFSLPGIAAQHALNRFGPQGLSRAAAPFLGGYMDLGGSIAQRNVTVHGITGVVDTLEDAAKVYWDKHGVKEMSKYAPKTWLRRPGGGTGAWSDKMISSITGAGEGTFAANRRIMAMMGRQISTSGGWLSRAGLKAGLEAAGGGLAGGLRLGMYGLSRALGPVGWGLMAYDIGRAGFAAYKAINNAAEVAHSRQFQETAVPFANGYQAQTQRRQALMSIQQSRLNARSAFGYEAKRFHAL